MDMQDKDLDKLFQSALDDYEIEPSAGVWNGITETLDARKRKRVWLPYLSVAAAAVLVVTAGLLFMPKEAVVIKHKDNSVAKSVVPIKANPIVNPILATPVIAQPNKNTPAVVTAQVNVLATTRIHKAHEPVQSVQNNNSAALKQNEQPVLASANVNEDMAKPVVPDTATKIIAKPVIDQKPVFASIKPTVLPEQTAAIKAVTPVKKHKIRSLGDVFNVVIAAVDKRKDKIIEFSNTDEDDATITGVNLGIVKIKKEK
ncbi:hypothetical protein [Mucilaginibacter flavus]|uniref:hypothetical protein n=1 Tax=Mucilaginibacter flavus TaxID=931504 RepID=UPI0025B3B099|nr:hypothetical protein [Mucilaginibacter flavus]MDN3581489.1 hypothetical protein [Mucilaginibacter flavus]